MPQRTRIVFAVLLFCFGSLSSSHAGTVSDCLLRYRLIGKFRDYSQPPNTTLGKIERILAAQKPVDWPAQDSNAGALSKGWQKLREKRLLTDIEISNGQASLRLGDIELTKDRRFLGLISQALKEGNIKSIDFGVVVGPKALNTIVHWSELAAKVPNGPVVRFRGQLRMVYVWDSIVKQISGPTTEGPKFWTETEVNAFNRAVEDLKIKTACRNIWQMELHQCPEMTFQFASDRPRKIFWSP